jgi:NAD dependent epimerase/dehydratase family enzyme
MPQKVLITGGTGLIGSRLTELLLEKGYEVAYLSRRKSEGTRVRAYQWDLEKGHVAEEAIREADCIIHLAGAGVADERWTARRKKEILESRTQSSRLLYEGLQRVPNQVKTFCRLQPSAFTAPTGARNC